MWCAHVSLCVHQFYSVCTAHMLYTVHACANTVYVHAGLYVHMHESDTHQLLLLHALHENDEQMLGLCAAVGESLLDSHQQLVS